MSSAVKEAQSKIRRWRENPAQFVYEVFGVELDAWQLKAMAPLGGSPNPRRRLAMKACTGPGKSATLAWMGWHRLLCFADKGEHPKGAALSGEGRDNLRDNLWAELAKWQQRSELLKRAFTHNQSQIYANDHPETWFLSARSYPKAANAEQIGSALAGLHSRYPFILLDEMGNMPPTVGQKATQIFTGGVTDGLIAGAGNPTSTTGLLYVIWTQEADLWARITITADPDDPERTPRVDPGHAREMINKYGRDNPWVMATILGKFPKTGFNTLLSIEEVEASMRRAIREDAFSWSQKRLGVDVARFGDDRTIIFPRQGLMAFKYVEMRGARTDAIAARVIQARAKWGSEMEFVDGTGGFGAGVIDNLITAGYSPMEVNFSSESLDPQYYNKRAEIWFEMAQWVKRGGALPQDATLSQELIAPTYTLKDGKLLLEPKEAIKKRLGYSPDIADALAMTFAIADMPAATSPQGIMQSLKGSHHYDYDPMAEA